MEFKLIKILRSAYEELIIFLCCSLLHRFEVYPLSTEY
ncbi:hypothetical protein DOT_3332 [Desulfosporosinus sp. OT]|nr:hypothetical protein DOT_3332 [Desulfosporosinus sp. OT]